LATAQAPGPGARAAPRAPTAARSERQGFFGAFGNWMQHGVANAGAGFGAMVGAVGGQATQAAKGAADAARNAATGVAKLPVSGVTAGRERCLPAPNGAPDSGAPAMALCRAKGSAAGGSFTFETFERSPPRHRVAAPPPPAGY